MSSVSESRGVQYSAETAGADGTMRCAVTRRKLMAERRAQYSIAVFNETGAPAQALAFVPDDADGGPRPIAQTVIGPRSNFSTTVELDFTPAGLTPVVRVVISSGKTEFSLEVPAVRADVAQGVEPAKTERARDTPRPGETALAMPRPVAAPALPTIYEPPYAPQHPPGGIVNGAPRPVAPYAARGPASPSIFPLLIVFTALLAAVGALIGRPHILDLRVPASAAAGAAVAVTYHATGIGSANYTVLGPDGRSVDSGPLTLGSGGFDFTLPHGSSAPAYLVRIDVASVLGPAVAEKYVRVDAPAATPPPPVRAVRQPTPVPPSPPPAIRSLAVDRATVASGETLTVYYDVAASGGSIVLIDPASQITYGRADFSPSGHTAFVAPRVDGSRLLTVIATAQRGGATTESRIAVTVTPPDAAPSLTGEATDTQPDGPAGGSASGTAISAPPSVHSGQPIRVDISGATTGLEVVFLDETGRELARRDVAAGARSVAFTAPSVRVPTRYLFEATYPRGVGSETVVRAIAVLP